MLLRRTVIAASLSLACGPSVALDDDGGGETSDGTSTSATITVGSATAMTSATTVSTTAMTSATTVGDESTSLDPSTTDADESGSDSMAFIEDPDGGGICFTHCRCDVWAQDCARGDKCMPWANDGGEAWNATRCSPIDPAPAAVGEPCVVETSGVSGFDNCGSSAMCWGVDPVTLEGTCVGFCDGSEANPQCPNGLECIIAFEGTLILCLPPCDPLAPVCAEDETCMSIGGQYSQPSGQFTCLPTPPFVPHAYGDACDGYLQLCDAGLVCAPSEHVPGCADMGCCTTVGDLAAPPVCPDMTQSCIPFEPDATEGPCFCGVP